MVYNNMKEVNWLEMAKILDLENNDWIELTPQEMTNKYPILSKLMKWVKWLLSYDYLRPPFKRLFWD